MKKHVRSQLIKSLRTERKQIRTRSYESRQEPLESLHVGKRPTTPRVEDRISKKGSNEYWRGRRKGANFGRNVLRGPNHNLSQSLSQTQMQYLSDQELAIIQRVAENEKVFGRLFPQE